MGYKSVMTAAFTLADDNEEIDWSIEYVMRRELRVSRKELEEMPYTKVMFMLDKLKREAEEVKRNIDQAKM